GCTLYTTLEPCTERGPGKTACADWLIQHKVARVVVGITDPNSVVAGRGMERLRAAGVVVDLARPDQASELKSLDAHWIALFDESRRPWRSLRPMKKARERHAAAPYMN